MILHCFLIRILNKTNNNNNPCCDYISPSGIWNLRRHQKQLFSSLLSIIDIITFYLSGTFDVQTHGTHRYSIKIKINLLTFLDWLNTEHIAIRSKILFQFDLCVFFFLFVFTSKWQCQLKYDHYFSYRHRWQRYIRSKRGNLLFRFDSSTVRYTYSFIVYRFIDKRSVEINNKSGICEMKSNIVHRVTSFRWAFVYRIRDKIECNSKICMTWSIVLFDDRCMNVFAQFKSIEL